MGFTTSLSTAFRILQISVQYQVCLRWTFNTSEKEFLTRLWDKKVDRTLRLLLCSNVLSLEMPFDMKVKWNCYSLSPLQLFFAASWTLAHQAPQSIGFSRQESWSGLPFPLQKIFLDQEIEPRSPVLQAYSLPSEPSRKPFDMGFPKCN